MVRKESSNMLYQLDFPIFNIKFISNNLFVISGGGGSSKTGVPNKIIFFKISFDNNKKSVQSENICEIDTREYLANSIEYIREKSMLFVGFNEAFQIYRLNITEDGVKTTIETSSIGIFDICDFNDGDNCDSDIFLMPDTSTRKSVGDVSSCSIRAATNELDSYISDLIILPDKYSSGDTRIIVAFNYGLVVFSEIKDDINFEIQKWRSYKPIKRFKIDPTHRTIIHLTPDGIIYIWSYPKFQLVSNIDLNKDNLLNLTRISCKCFTFITDPITRKPMLVAAFTKSSPKNNPNKKYSSQTTFIYKFGIDDYLPMDNGICVKMDRIVSIDALETSSRCYIACGTQNGSIIALDGQNSKILGESSHVHSIGVTSLSFTKGFCDNDDGSLGIVSCSADSSCAYTPFLKLTHQRSSLPFIFIALFLLGIIASLIIGTQIEITLLA